MHRSHLIVALTLGAAGTHTIYFEEVHFAGAAAAAAAVGLASLSTTVSVSNPLSTTVRTSSRAERRTLTRAVVAGAAVVVAMELLLMDGALAVQLELGEGEALFIGRGEGPGSRTFKGDGPGTGASRTAGPHHFASPALALRSNKIVAPTAASRSPVRGDP